MMKGYSTPSQILTKAQAAEFVGLTMAQVERLRNLGQFPEPILHGRCRAVWTAGDLVDWLQSQSAGRPA